ncbi:dTDP-4-dehydrorhamnose reductase [Lutibacter sp.]|uniref:dTDP-4-dehydrorhamnose reductase n=1 Tax=Lutibacter sp. TaxID=1925666 RepID=UPI0027357F1C|nr:dTDP-4-dehydrorhamnose reductase [Lutibacter sp.]MDP3313304.1 dTDP-4-dehydrorhamnose reductase [Lutibacter sp.]
MKERINLLVTGSNGQLGQEIRELASNFRGYNFFFTSKADLDITDFHAVENFISQNKIKVIINCAAYTHVDKAEDEAHLAQNINHFAVKNLAQLAQKNQIKLIHISTDYVFDGNSEIPYTESAATNPQNEYGRSKLNGENAILEINPANSVIIRTSWLYSSYGTNFVKNIIKLAKEKDELSVVSDQIGSPTYAKDVASFILKILPTISNNNVEIYHYTNYGSCSWFEFASEIVKNTALKCVIVPISTVEFNAKAYRPKFSLLATTKIKKIGKVSIPNWETSLKNCIKKLNLR